MPDAIHIKLIMRMRTNIDIMEEKLDIAIFRELGKDANRNVVELVRELILTPPVSNETFYVNSDNESTLCFISNGTMRIIIKNMDTLNKMDDIIHRLRIHDFSKSAFAIRHSDNVANVTLHPDLSNPILNRRICVYGERKYVM
jgi:hypothetical protein